MNTTSQRDASTKASSEIHPGDDALPGTPGTGEDICPKCKGTGKINGNECENCGGTGKITEGIGGG